MVRYAPGWDAKLGREIQVEINDGHCPRHPDAVQRPGWTGVKDHGHRTWTCDVCWHVTHDPTCQKCDAAATRSEDASRSSTE